MHSQNAVQTPASEARRHLLLAPALHRGGDAQRLAVLGDRAPGDVDAVALQLLDDLVVGQHGGRRLGIDQLADAVAHGLGGVRLARRPPRRSPR